MWIDYVNLFRILFSLAFIVVQILSRISIENDSLGRINFLDESFIYPSSIPTTSKPSSCIPTTSMPSSCIPTTSMPSSSMPTSSSPISRSSYPSSSSPISCTPTSSFRPSSHTPTTGPTGPYLKLTFPVSQVNSVSVNV